MRRQSPILRLTAAALYLAGASAAVAADPTFASAAKPSAAAQQPRGKPVSGVIVEHSVPGKIAVGEAVTVKLRFSGVTSPEGATVEVRDPSTRATLASLWLAQGEKRTIELPYRSVNDGMQFIDVTTVQAGRGSVESVALRVGSGDLRLKSPGKLQTTAEGEAVIVMPLRTE